MMTNQNRSRKKRIMYVLFAVFLIFILLLVRLAFLQFVQGSWLSEMAYNQQSLDRQINPKRGTIYDATRKKRISCKCNGRDGYH